MQLFLCICAVLLLFACIHRVYFFLIQLLLPIKKKKRKKERKKERNSRVFEDEGHSVQGCKFCFICNLWKWVIRGF